MQVVGYDARDDESEGGLYLAGEGAGEAAGRPDADASEVVRLDCGPGTELAFGLDDRRCAGTIHDGEHLACDAADAPYCDAHSSVWVCARCTGSCLKDEMDCTEPHALYLAAFAPDTFKVGVTREWRVETRLREQGADRAAHVRTYPNGRIVREVEAELARDPESELVDRVRVPTKIDGFADSVDNDDWEDLLDRFDPETTYEFEYGLDLDERPMVETMAAGTVRGWKGRVLVLDRNGTTYAVDARDLVGYELTEEVPDRDLQSSLGAFGG